jgi:hypothetical protein
MADEEPSVNPTNIELEKTLTEIISTNEPETASQNQETETMEVHKHSQHITHKKKWGEYLLEFFMLFLAVFLGFLAENVREHLAEKVKEKEYMVSMLNDLNKDSLSINTSIDINEKFIKGYNSTLRFLSSNLRDQDTAEKALLYFYSYCIYTRFVRNNDGTITQLKNNGGLRLLRNKDVINKINSYYNEVRNIKSQEESIMEFLNIIDRQAGGIFNYVSNRPFIDSANLAEGVLFEMPINKVRNWLTHGSPTMLTTDINILSPFMSNMSYEMGLIQTYISLLNKQKERASELKLAINQGYDLQNE